MMFGESTAFGGFGLLNVVDFFCRFYTPGCKMPGFYNLDINVRGLLPPTRLSLR
jgi:hypothetical protein